MKKNGYTVVELAIVLGVFSICYFAATWVISSKLNVNYEEEMYKERIASIELGAFYYAKSSENLFKEENTVYVTVEDLAKNNVVRSNNGTVIDPRDEESSMNNIKVKITNENDEITAKVLS